MDIVVNEELKAYIDPLTPEEHAALERSILAEGCRDALVLWGDVLVDGHNRYGICRAHGLPYQTVQNTRFQSIEDVHLWMIDQHLGRRSVSDFQRGVLALRKREIVATRRARDASIPDAPAAGREDGAAMEPPAARPDANGQPGQDLGSREAIAKAARLSSSQVAMIEKIQQQAAPELVEAIRSGNVSINAAAAIATLPKDEQQAAVVAGKDELRQAAKRVREARRKPRDEAPADAPPAHDAPGAAVDELTRLRRRVDELEAENAALRQRLADLQPASF